MYRHNYLFVLQPEEGLPTAVYQEDPNADSKSMTRAGSDSLFLVVKRNRNDFQWQFPQGKVLEGETLRGVSSNFDHLKDSYIVYHPAINNYNFTNFIVQ